MAHISLSTISAVKYIFAVDSLLTIRNFIEKSYYSTKTLGTYYNVAAVSEKSGLSLASDVSN